MNLKSHIWEAPEMGFQPACWFRSSAHRQTPLRCRSVEFILLSVKRGPLLTGVLESSLISFCNSSLSLLSTKYWYCQGSAALDLVSSSSFFKFSGDEFFPLSILYSYLVEGTGRTDSLFYKPLFIQTFRGTGLTNWLFHSLPSIPYSLNQDIWEIPWFYIFFKAPRPSWKLKTIGIFNLGGLDVFFES